MATKSKTLPAPPAEVVTVETGADAIQIHFYIGGGAPRVVVDFLDATGAIKYHSDHALSEYSLSGAQKTTLRNLLTTIRDETFTLEGFA